MQTEHYILLCGYGFGDLFEGEKGEIVMSDERLKVFAFSRKRGDLRWKDRKIACSCKKVFA